MSFSIPVQTADGKITLLDVVQANSGDQYAIRVQTADGKESLISAFPVTATDEYCIIVQTADGKEVLVSLGGEREYQVVLAPTNFQASESSFRIKMNTDSSFIGYSRSWRSAGFPPTDTDPMTEPLWTWPDPNAGKWCMQLFNDGEIIHDFDLGGSRGDRVGINQGTTQPTFYEYLSSLTVFTTTNFTIPDGIKINVFDWVDAGIDINCDIFYQRAANPNVEIGILVDAEILAHGNYTFQSGVTGLTPEIALEPGPPT